MVLTVPCAVFPDDAKISPEGIDSYVPTGTERINVRLRHLSLDHRCGISHGLFLRTSDAGGGEVVPSACGVPRFTCCAELIR